jgi:outer membrane protein assembly factor BamA
MLGMLTTALAAALFSTALALQAQQFVPKSIQFQGNPEYSNEELLAASGLKKGAVLNYAQMNQVSKVLMDTGMFASLTFKFDGQDLIFELTPADQFLSIHLDNLPLTPGPDLDAKLHQQLPLYHGKIPSEGGTQEQVRAALEKMLEDQGLKATGRSQNTPRGFRPLLHRHPTGTGRRQTDRRRIARLP